MKRITMLMLIACLTIIPLLAQKAPAAKPAAPAESSFYIALYGNFFSSGDSGFRDVYGSVIVPELKLGYRLFDQLSVWAGFGYLSKSGTTIGDLQLTTSTTQYHISGGLEYMLKLGDTMRLRVAGGVIYFSVKDESMGDTIDENKLGFRGDLGLVYLLSQSIFIELTGGYSSATDTLYAGTTDEMQVTLGGFKAGVGIGLRL
jgi:opacity protein-like surface antigen